MSSRPAILVTGGAGYIGSHCCKALHEAGLLPVSIDDLSSGHGRFVKWGPLIEARCQDPDVLRTIFREYNIQAVIHLAASSIVSESVMRPDLYYENNVSGSLSLLRILREENCNRIVFSSSGAVYGNPPNGPLDEDVPCNPINPYGASKLIVERILQDYRVAYGLNSFSLRYFNASGADPSGELGEFRSNETHLIPRAMMVLQGRLAEFNVYGRDFETPDGTAIRDYVHVSDLAAAHVKAIKLLLDGMSGMVVNLGTGRGHSVLEILKAITNETGRTVPYQSKERRFGDPPILVADPSRANKILNLRPTFSDLETIVRTAWRWNCSAYLGNLQQLEMSAHLSQ